MRHFIQTIAYQVICVAIIFVAAPSRAEEKAESARFLHEPQATIPPGSRLIVKGKMQPRLAISKMRLAYRHAGEEHWQETSFKRLEQDTAVAEVSEATVESPGVEYYVYIPSENQGGELEYLFASRDDPYRVLVHGYSKRTRYESRKAEWNGRLSRAELNYGYSHFGENLSRSSDTESEEFEKTDQGNYYHEVNVAYTYRFLTYLYALRMEVSGVAHDFGDFKPFTAGKDKSIGPGMYAISPSVDFEFAKYFGASVLMRLGISEEEFEGGAGTSLRIGRINGTRLDLGFEGMSHAGWRIFMRFEWDTVPYVPMAFNLERTQWYAAESYAEESWGNRMYYEARLTLPLGIGLRAHIGFASRDASVQSGIVVGGGAYVDF